MIRCMAIDDEPLALRQIENYIKRIEDLELVALCSNANDAAAVLSAKDLDLLFVDINMPDMSGIDFVRSLENPPIIVFTTAYSEYAVEGFRLDAVDYLLKPFSFDDFAHSVGKVRSLLELYELRNSATKPAAEVASVSESSDDEYISIKADYKVSLVRYADIVYMESVGEYVRLHLTNGPCITTLFRLKNMEVALPSDRFMRVHRSYIINLKHIAGYSRGAVMLDNGEHVPVGAAYRDVFRDFVERKRSVSL